MVSLSRFSSQCYSVEHSDLQMRCCVFHILLGYQGLIALTHWGRVTHICVSKPTIIGSDNGLSNGWRQGIIWPNAGILLISPLGTNFSEILIKIHTFSFNKIDLKILSAKWGPLYPGLNILSWLPNIFLFVKLAFLMHHFCMQWWHKCKYLFLENVSKQLCS